MIHSRSTYNKEYTWFNFGGPDIAERAVIEIKIWAGNKNTIPTDVTYKMEVINPLASTGTFKVNISDFIQEYVQNNLITYDANTDVYLDANDSLVWVETRPFFYLGNDVTDLVGTIELASRAYQYSDEVSFDFTTNVHNTFNHSIVSRNSVFVLPILQGSYTLDVVSLPNNTINYTTTLTASDLSNEQIQRLVITNLDECYLAGDTNIQVSIDSNLVHTIEIKNEKKYNPFDVFFINRFGQLENLTFFREKTETLKTKGEEYERSNGLPINGLHQFVNYNLNGRSSFKANTGYLKEIYNEKIRQLMLSDAHWMFKDNRFLPINLTSTSQEYKTRQKDRLINYEFEFSYSFNEINKL